MLYSNDSYIGLKNFKADIRNKLQHKTPKALCSPQAHQGTFHYQSILFNDLPRGLTSGRHGRKTCKRSRHTEQIQSGQINAANKLRKERFRQPVAFPLLTQELSTGKFLYLGQRPNTTSWNIPPGNRSWNLFLIFSKQ